MRPICWTSSIVAVVAVLVVCSKRAVPSRGLQPRSLAPSGLPERTSDPGKAFELAREQGASILTGVDMSAAGVSDASFRVFGEALLAVQAPVHVGTNNFGFKGGTPITNLEARPAHVDTIVQYRVEPYEAPDFFMLCARRPSPGGESFLTSLRAAVRRMPAEHRKHIDRLSTVQRIQLPPDYDRLSDNSTDRTQAQQSEHAAPAPTDRVERFVVPNPIAGQRPAIRISSFSDADALLAALETEEAPPVRPLPTSLRPDFDMQTVMHFLRAVAAETAEAARFRLEEGECVVVDNFLTAHGREAYTDLGRAMWQVWAWTNESLAVPPAAGPNREWLKRPPTSGHAAAKDEVE